MNPWKMAAINYIDTVGDQQHTFVFACPFTSDANNEGVTDPSEAAPSEGAEMDNFDEPEFDDFDGGDDVDIGTPRMDSIQDTSGLRSSKQGYHPTQKYLESIQTNNVVLPIAYTMGAYTMGNNMYDHDSDEMPELDDPIAFLAATAKGDPDTMYYHQAMKQPDLLQFKQAMQSKIDAHTENDHWDIIAREDVPKEHKVLDSVWAMKQKHQILSRKIYKWKAHLNVHGGQQIHGVNFWDTFAPVVTWMSI
jgi:hypothetical protein